MRLLQRVLFGVPQHHSVLLSLVLLPGALQLVRITGSRKSLMDMPLMPF